MHNGRVCVCVCVTATKVWREYSNTKRVLSIFKFFFLSIFFFLSFQTRPRLFRVAPKRFILLATVHNANFIVFNNSRSQNNSRCFVNSINFSLDVQFPVVFDLARTYHYRNASFAKYNQVWRRSLPRNTKML